MKFSICIPNYNYGRYLGETLRSVLTQSYADFEIIVADNASTDDSIAVVESMRDPRIRLIRNRYNVGFAHNLDRATAGARHDFMILLSSDDLMRPGALAAYAKVLRDRGEEARHTVLASATDVIDSAGAVTGVMWRPPGEFFYQQLSPADAERVSWDALAPQAQPGLDLLRASLCRKDVVASFLSTCYPRELYDAVEGYSSLHRMAPDAHFLRKLLAQNPQVIYLPQRLFAYRVHNQNQNAAELSSGALKYQVDGYMQVVEFPQSVLDQVGLTRADLAKVFVERGVVRAGLGALASGAWRKAFKCLAFGFASYPGYTLRQWRTYPLAGLLALGPLGKWLARVLHRHSLRRRAAPARPRS